ncbi:MAG: gamma-glutamyltransferase family protein [Acetobacteraceae bacterium]|nr:gamma-glutamyltransferase family protein [Acetobacteraceae bacterium]
MPIIVWEAKERRARVLCGQGPAPAGASLAHYRDRLGLDLVPGTGLLAACVPGAFDAWMLLLRDLGTLTPAEVLAPAIAYARDGIPVLPRISATIASVAPLFRHEWTSSAAVFLPGGAVPAPGTRFCNPALAATYERIARESEAGGGSREQRIERARRSWAEGFVAEAVDRFVRETEAFDTSGRRNRGVLTGADMASYRARWEEPVAFDYAGVTVLKCGPWSQGPVQLQTLALLAGFDLSSLDPCSAEFVHLVVEAEKLAFADREAWYGDPDFVDVPIGHLLSPAYTEARRALIGKEASYALRPGSVPGRSTPWVDHAAAARALGPLEAAAGEPTLARLGAVGGDTCHLDVIDRWGNIVSATPSGGWLQSSPVIPGLGFPLGTRAQMFWLRDDHPNGLAPGKRPRTTLSPSLALKDGEGWMAYGTPGGDQQDQWSVVFLLRMLHWGFSIQQAIDAPAFHCRHWPSSFWPRAARPGEIVLEERFGPETIAALRARGHDVVVGPAWSEGRLSAARREGAFLTAGANPRGMQGYAVGR